MSTIEFINKEVSTLPNHLAEEVASYIKYLKHKELLENIELYIANESALKDWLTPEEDAAWQNL